MYPMSVKTLFQAGQETLVYMYILYLYTLCRSRSVLFLRDPDLTDSTMATPSFISVDKHRNVLQGIILTAVYCKHNTAIHRAVEVIREQKLDEKDKQKGGKQSLDFLPSKHAQVSH